MAVLLYHVAPGAVPGGFLGVEAFFVLSGYLLTALLLDEHRRTGTIDRWAYAARRVRRIYPGLIVLLAALVVFVPVLDHADAHRLPGDVLSSLLGVTNWHLIAGGVSYFSHLGNPSFVRHLWSIAIEVQFYVLCPFLVGWLARQRTAVAVRALLCGIGASSLAMAVLYRAPDPSRAYFGTDTRIGALLAGCLLAVVLRRGGDAMSPRYRTTWSQVAGPLALVVLCSLVLAAQQTSRLLYPAGFLLTQVATGTIIVVALRPGWLTGFLARRDLRWLGRRSYGIYLWHWPLVVLTLHWSSRLGAAAVTIASALVLGALSYGLVERPFMRAGRRAGGVRRRAGLRRRRARFAAVAAAVVGTVVLLVRIPTTDPIAHSLKVGQEVLARQVTPVAAGTLSPSTVTPTLPTGLTTSSAPLPPASPPPPPPPPPPIPVIAIGDSVMVGAAPALQARLGSSGFIDAQIGRQFDEGVRVVQGLRQRGRIGRVVIVHLGDNGAVTPGGVDALLGQLAGVPTVLFVNVRVTRPWQDEVNQTLAAAAARHPEMKLVDWFNQSAPHGDWFAGDGTHVKESGAAAFADLLVGSIPPPPTTTVPPTTTTTRPSPPLTTNHGPSPPG